MDEFSSRKGAAALSFSRKSSSGLVLRNSAEKGDRNTQVCSRVGCGSRVNSSKGNQIGCSGKAKTTRHPYGLSNSGKQVVGSSSKSPPLGQSGPRKPNSDPQKKSPSHRVAGLETKSHSENLEASDPITGRNNSQVRLNTLVLHNNVSGEASSSSSTPHSRDGKKTMRRPELDVRDSSIGPSASLAIKQGNNGVRNGASASKYNLRNLKCSSINDVVSSGCSASSSDLNLDRNRVMSRKRIGVAEGGLFTRGKKINGPAVDDRRNDTSSRGISIASSRRTRNSTFTRDNDDKSVGISRSAARSGLNEQDSGNRLESSNAPRRPGTSRANVNSNDSLATFDPGFGSSFLNTDNAGRYSLNGVAEMLLALDGIEQDEEPSYEQMLAMETNFLLGGLVLHDQHRDMRLDIDNMSYEELLTLGERMGTVSTALTEEALEKCLKKNIYQATTTAEGTVIGETDDIKCCICQEEYEEGNKVGRLGCDHQYHVECIRKWLQIKNWCPICKASAEPSPSLLKIS